MLQYKVRVMVDDFDLAEREQLRVTLCGVTVFCPKNQGVLNSKHDAQCTSRAHEVSFVFAFPHVLHVSQCVAVALMVTAFSTLRHVDGVRIHLRLCGH